MQTNFLNKCDNFNSFLYKMGGRVIKVYLFIEVLVCFIWVKVGSHPQPMTLFYQNQVTISD